MNESIMPYKTPSADLHRKSPRIFFISLAVSAAATFFLLIAPLPEEKAVEKQYAPPPVIIQLQTIPQTRHVVAQPAAPRPPITSGQPVEVNDIMPDDVTIEDTANDVQALPPAPGVNVVPNAGAAKEENEIFEYYAVEEQPVRLNSVVPEYPPMAERAEFQGTIFLRLLVNTSGSVDSVIVEKGPEIFRESAIKAAKATTFKSAKQNDRPVACWVILPFRFVIEKP